MLRRLLVMQLMIRALQLTGKTARNLYWLQMEPRKRHRDLMRQRFTKKSWGELRSSQVMARSASAAASLTALSDFGPAWMTAAVTAR
jgi:hypothetical protein